MGNLLFQRTLGIEDHTQLKYMLTCNHIQQANKITQHFRKILELCYFREGSACQGMPDQTQQRLHDLTKASLDIQLHAKNEHYTSNSF